MKSNKSITLVTMIISLTVILSLGMQFNIQSATAEMTHMIVTNDPQLSIHIDENNIFIFYLPKSVIVTITIDDPETPISPDFSASPIDWNPAGQWYQLILGDSFILQPGQIVNMITDIGISRSITIIPLSITNIDMKSDTISGQTAPNVTLAVYTGPGWSIGRCVNADNTGHWIADFSVPGNGLCGGEGSTFDITYGSSGQTYYVDNGGSTVQVDWFISFKTYIPTIWNVP